MARARRHLRNCLAPIYESGCQTSTLWPAGSPSAWVASHPRFVEWLEQGRDVTRLQSWTDDRLFYAVIAARSAAAALRDARIEFDRIPFSECGSTSSRSLKERRLARRPCPETKNHGKAGCFLVAGQRVVPKAFVRRRCGTRRGRATIDGSRVVGMVGVWLPSRIQYTRTRRFSPTEASISSSIR
jgi:hypothetical protein